ncbi:MAG: coproporphyrinogen III oxidase [Firmicutes bacterium HGW-Firmicutes-14]|jgi:oxygen-independent coproporphyrinogen-3 oxidase|nr:MAG: coproporphyrinogen III oxidase [Firmicutes bacterium HGW-Firmicutes-14]
MAVGLYIHIPFCIKKCGYCDFVSYPYDAGLAASYLSALEKEMALCSREFGGEQKVFGSIYLGGGTPTALTGGQVAGIIDRCRNHFSLAGDVEITVECNPGTVDPEKMDTIRKSGVNRVSIGVQAYQQRLLSGLGRIHTWREVVQAADSCRSAGFDNISFDLIFGIPGQTRNDWQETMDRVLEMSPRHISAYCLKIEPGTPLHREVTTGPVTPCDEDLELEMFWCTVDKLTGCGFKHYEISNFALPGWEARHNLIYWHNEEYLGLGPAAHSMLNGIRFNNVESVELYIKKLNRGELPVSQARVLTVTEQMAETVFLGLRLIDGLDPGVFAERFGRTINEVYGDRLEKLVCLELLEAGENRLKLTKKGLPLANEVFVEFI